jgi:hypothetical protein
MAISRITQNGKIDKRLIGGPKDKRKSLEEFFGAMSKGELSFVGEVSIRKQGRRRVRYVMCVCSCGKELQRPISNIVRSEHPSCGCYMPLICSKNRTEHGHSIKGKVAPEYRAWHSMKNRCLDKNTKYYHNYGGRGISVCQRWLFSYENFYNDMGQRPSNKHSLDRIDVNGNYEPDNCRWATIKTQALNRQNTVSVIYNNEEISAADFSQKTAISSKWIRQQARVGVSGEDMIRKVIEGLENMMKT